MGKDLECPICCADVPLGGDEKPGEELFCAYCRAPLTLKGDSEDEYELEDDL
jgi:hypothetical protein